MRLPVGLWNRSSNRRAFTKPVGFELYASVDHDGPRGISSHFQPVFDLRRRGKCVSCIFGSDPEDAGCGEGKRQVRRI